MGIPRQYPDLDKTKRIMLDCRSPGDFYVTYGVSKAVYYKWKKRHPEFMDLVKELGRGGKRHPGGAKPLKIDPERIKKLSAIGLNKQQVAAQLNIGYSTYMDHQRAHPELRDAFEIGKEVGVATIKGVLFSKAQSGNDTSIALYLKRHDHETIESPDRIQIDVIYTDQSAAKLTGEDNEDF